MRAVHASLGLLLVGVIMSGALAIAASDAPCQSGPDECHWTTLQCVAAGALAVTFAIGIIVVVALVRAVVSTHEGA